MATITINIPVDKEAWVLDGFSVRFGYQTMVTNPDYDPEASDPGDPTIPNPETLEAFAKRMIIHMIKQAALDGHNNVSNEANAVEANTVNLT